MTENLTALKLFVRVAATRSFSKAARELRLSQPTASRMISELEKELGAAFFARTTRAVTLTEAGAEYLARLSPILAALEEANHSVRGSAQLRGVLRIGLSSSAGIREIIPRLPKFAARHPALRIELLVNDQRQDLVLEGVDVAIRLGSLKSSSAVARKITTLHRILAASPAYLSKMGTPKVPADLASHRLISGPVATSAGLPFATGDRVKVDSTLFVSLNEGAIAAAVAGLGIVLTGMSTSLPEFARGTLVRLLPDWEMERIEVHAVYANGRAAKPAARVFTEFLLAEFQSGPPVATL
jgi:DNA-binding transcriptional LysR family regulator